MCRSPTFAVAILCANLVLTTAVKVTPTVGFTCMPFDKLQYHSTCTLGIQTYEEQADYLSSPSSRRNISECLNYPCYNITCPVGEKCGTDNTKKVYVYVSDIRNTAPATDTAAFDQHSMITVNYTFRPAIFNVTGLHPATPDVDYASQGGELVFDGRKQALKIKTNANKAFEQSLEVTVTADGIYEATDEEFDIVIQDPVWYNYVYDWDFNTNVGVDPEKVKTEYFSLFSSQDKAVRFVSGVQQGFLGTLDEEKFESDGVTPMPGYCADLPTPDDDDDTECNVKLDDTEEVIKVLAYTLRKYKVILSDAYNASSVDFFQERNIGGAGYERKETTEAYLRISDPDDSGVFMFSSSEYEFLEAKENGDQNTAILTVTRVGGQSGQISVDFESDRFRNTAIAGADYDKLPTRPHGMSLDQPAQNTLIFEQGETVKYINVPLRGDELFEYVPGQVGKNDEYFLIKLVNSQPERQYEQGRPVAPLYLKGSYAEYITEAALSNTMIPSTARVVILDDGDAGMLDFTQTDYYVREDAEFVTLTVTRTKGGRDNPGSGGHSTSCCKEVTINIATAEDSTGLNTALADFDYRNTLIGGESNNLIKNGVCRGKGYENCWKESEQKLNWPNNIDQLEVTVPILNDPDYEGTDEFVMVHLLNVAGGARLGKYNTTKVHILDDRDAGTFSFNASSYDVSEDAALVTVTVVRTGLADGINTYTSGNVSVGIRSVGEWKNDYLQKGTSRNWENDYGIVEHRGCDSESPCIATPGEDYTAIPLTTLYFPEGQSSMEFTINITDDNLFEAPNEAFKLELVDPTNGTHIAQDSAHPLPWSTTMFIGHGQLAGSKVYEALERDLPAQNDLPTTVVTILDNADPAVKISRSSMVSTEGGAVDTYEVSLNSKPTSPVTIHLVKSKDDEIHLSTEELIFEDSKTDGWNITQTIIVTATDDAEDEKQEGHTIQHLVRSTDTDYNGAPRRTANEAGTVFANFVFDSDPLGLVDGQGPWIPQISIKNQVPCNKPVKTFCEWCGTKFLEKYHPLVSVEKNGGLREECVTSRRAVQTAPFSEFVNSFVNDNDHAGIQLESDRTRFKSDGSELSVSVRKDGFKSSYSVWLRTFPAAPVTVKISSPSPWLVVQPTQLVFGSSNTSWLTPQVVEISVASDASLTRTETAKITHSSESQDEKYDGVSVPIHPGPITVMVYDKVGVKLSKSDIQLDENGIGDNYTAVLQAEPMHAELVDRAALPYRFEVFADADTTIDQKLSNDTSLGEADKLHIATPFPNKPPHASRDWEPTFTKMALLTFPLSGNEEWPSAGTPSVAQRAAGLRMGTTRLRLYRLNGGENGGALGVAIGASVVNSTTWEEKKMSWLCVTDQCRCSGGHHASSSASSSNSTRQLSSMDDSDILDLDFGDEMEHAMGGDRRLLEGSYGEPSEGGSYGSYGSYSAKTSSPTAQPSSAPTLEKLDLPHQVNFSMGVTGYSVAEFDSSAQEAFKKAISKTTVVQLSQVVLSGLCQTGGTPAAGVQVCSSSRRRSLADTVSVQFDVTINVEGSFGAENVKAKAVAIKADPTALVTEYKAKLQEAGITPPAGLTVAVSGDISAGMPTTSAPTNFPTLAPTAPTTAPTSTPTTFDEYPCNYPTNKTENEYLPLNANLHAEVNDPQMISATSISLNTTTQFDFRNNTYIPQNEGWFELDVTDAVNAAIAAGHDKISFVLFTRTTADMILGFSDEVSFASREYPDTSKRPHLMLTPSGSCNIALGKSTLHSHANQGVALRAVDGLVNVPLTNGWAPYGGLYFSMSFKNSILDSGWWQVDLGNLYSIQKINVYTREEVTAAMTIYSNIDFYVMIGDEELGLGYKRVQGPGVGNLNKALGKATLYKKFSLERPATSAVGSAHVLKNEWVVGEPLVGNWSNGRIIKNDPAIPVGRYVLVQYEGRNFLPISEVEVFQPAMSGVDVTVGAYMPSPSTLSDTSQLAVSPSDACNDLKQCRSALTFTSGNWNVPQMVSVSALDDDVASGLRHAIVTHETTSSDIDYRGSKFFNPRPTVTAAIKDDDIAGITLSKKSTAVTEGAHTYLGAPLFSRQLEVPVIAVSCSKAPALKDNAQPCIGAKDQKKDTWWDTSISLKPLDPATWIVADFGPATPGPIVQMHIYKPQDIGSRGIKLLSLTHADMFTSNSIPGSWGAVAGRSTHDVPWGMTSGSINHTISGFSSNKRYIAVIFKKTYGGHAMGDGLEPSLVTPLEIHELTFTGSIPYSYPEHRGDWDVASTNISRMHLQSVADEYTVVLDSEPLSEVVVRPVVQDSEQLSTWDKFNSSFNSKYVEEVITGRYHVGNRKTEIATALYFNASTWHIPQTVQVSAVDNNVAAGDRVLSVSHKTNAEIIQFQPLQQMPIGKTHKFTQTILPLRAQYQYKNIEKYHTVNGTQEEWPRGLEFSYTSTTGKVSVAVTEDDKAGVTVSESHIYVTEGGSNGSFAVILDSEPTATVTINLNVAQSTSSKQLQVLVSPDVLVFDRLTWSVPQTVVISAHDDDVYEGRLPFTQTYSRYIPQPFSERILLTLASDDADYNKISIGQNEHLGPKLQYVRDQSIEVTVIDDDAGCLNEYKCTVPADEVEKYTSSDLCVAMDSYHFDPSQNPDSQPAQGGSTSSVCNCPHGYGMRDCSYQCMKMTLCEFRRIHFIIECNDDGVCTNSEGLNKEQFVKELTRAALLFNARLMEKLEFPAAATQQAFPGQHPASPYDMAASKLESDREAADQGNKPVIAPTRMPTPAPPAPSKAPSPAPSSAPTADDGSYSGGSYRRLVEDDTDFDEDEQRIEAGARKLLSIEMETKQVADKVARRLVGEAITEQPLELLPAWDNFYVVKALPTQCMFSFHKKCKVVTVDVKDGDGKLTDFLLKSERSGHFSKFPMRMQYAQQADTLNHSKGLIIIMWTVFGFLFFTFMVVLIYKVYKAFHSKQMTADEKKHYRESQQVF